MCLYPREIANYIVASTMPRSAIIFTSLSSATESLQGSSENQIWFIRGLPKSGRLEIKNDHHISTPRSRRNRSREKRRKTEKTSFIVVPLNHNPS